MLPSLRNSDSECISEFGFEVLTSPISLMRRRPRCSLAYQSNILPLTSRNSHLMVKENLVVGLVERR